MSGKLFTSKEELKEQKLSNLRLKSKKQAEEFQHKIEKQRLEKRQRELNERIRKLRLEHDSLNERIAGQKSLLDY